MWKSQGLTSAAVNHSKEEDLKHIHMLFIEYVLLTHKHKHIQKYGRPIISGLAGFYLVIRR